MSTWKITRATVVLRVSEALPGITIFAVGVGEGRPARWRLFHEGLEPVARGWTMSSVSLGLA